MNDRQLLERLDALRVRHTEVGELITDPGVIADQKRYVKLMKEYKDLEPLLDAQTEYKSLIDNIESSKELLSTEDDPEMREIAHDHFVRCHLVNET